MDKKFTFFLLTFLIGSSNLTALAGEKPETLSSDVSKVHRFSELKPNYEPWGLSSHEQVGIKTGAHIAGGVVFFKDKDYPWTVHYDEILYCQSVKGRFEIEINGKAQQMLPGDMVYLPEGTSVIYRAVGEATMFYAVTPVDWESRLPAEFRHQDK